MWWDLEDTLFSLFIGVICGLIMTLLYVITTSFWVSFPIRDLTWGVFLFILVIGIAMGFAIVAYTEYGVGIGEGTVTLWAWVEPKGKPLWIKAKASYNWMMREPDDIPAKRKTKKKVTKKKTKKKIKRK